jgi:plasmid stability protein
MPYDNNTALALTIRNMPRSLVSAMNMRAQKLGIAREQMLRELLLKEFADEERVILAIWDKSSNEIQGDLTIGGVRFHRFADRSDAEKLCKELAKEAKIHLVFYEGFWYCPFDSLVQAFGELKLPNCIVATYEKGPDEEIIEHKH